MDNTIYFVQHIFNIIISICLVYLAYNNLALFWTLFPFYGLAALLMFKKNPRGKNDKLPRHANTD